MFKRVLTIFLILIFCTLSFRVTHAVELTKVEYTLPYPGILPDSPFYFLKVIRDTTVSFFIRDSKQNAFYQLFLADKKLAAAQALVTSGKTKLGITTLVISQEHYHQAVETALKVKDRELTQKLIVSGVKRTEVMGDLQPKTSGSDLEKLVTALTSNLKDKSRVLELLMIK